MKLRLLFLLVLLINTGRGQTPFLTGLDLDFMELQSGILYWKAGCAPGPVSSIARVPAGSLAVATYFRPATCGGSNVDSANVAMDSARNVYWSTRDGRIVMLPADASTASTPVTLAQMAGAPSLATVRLAVSPVWVYWAETFGEFQSTGSLYRAPIGGGARELMLNFNQGADGGVVALHALGSNGITVFESVIYRRAGGKLVKATESLALPAWSETTLVAAVDTFKVIGGRIYYAETGGAGTLIRSRNASGLASVQTHASLSLAGSPVVTDITADSSAVYWREARSNTGPIMRQRLSGGAPEAITINLDAATSNRTLFLQSDGRTLYWRGSQSVIQKLPVNAGAVVFDLRPVAIEVVQAIQGPANDVPLVEKKQTWARVLSQFTVTGGTVPQLDRMPLAQLYGFKSPLAAPAELNVLHAESPLQPVTEGTTFPGAPDRNQVTAGAWFRLPLEWGVGRLKLKATLNDSRVINESDYSNNSITTEVSFQAANGLLLKVYPLRTHQGTIGTYQTDYQPVFDRAESLLPVARLSVDFGGRTMEEWNAPNPFSFGPYELSKEDDDSGWVMFKLIQRSLFRRAAGILSQEARDVHDVAFFTPFRQQAFNGKGVIPAIYTLGNLTLISHMATGTGSVPYNSAKGGVTLAHEIAHNWGRNHVNCPLGEPDDPDSGYPYGCTLAGATPYLGFDPISRSLIHSAGTGDLMSYEPKRWVSDYTWRACLQRVGPAPTRANPAPGDTGPQQFLAAVISPDGTAELSPALPLPDSTAAAAAASLIADADDTTTWSFVLRRRDGTVLATIPGAAKPTPDAGPQLVFALTTERAEAAILQLFRNNAPGIPQASLAGGGGQPVVMITAPAAGTVAGNALTLQWTASDPENTPLVFQVRYSPDAGASWELLADEVRQNELTIDTATLPGGSANAALLQVLASDGLLTTSATSARFTVSPKAPVPLISMESARSRTCGTVVSIPAGETLTLLGSAMDREDGPLPDTQLEWRVTGPDGSDRIATAREFLLRDLLPGSYPVRLRVSDSAGQKGTANTSFSVRPAAVPTAPSAPVLDGYGDDDAYRACLHPIPLRYPGGTSPAMVRTVIFGSTVYISITGMPAGTALPGDLVSISFDVNNSGENTAQASDIRFLATRDGEYYSARGDGAGGFLSSRSTTGFTARVTGDTIRWQAEYAIPLATLGATAGQLAAMDVSHASVAFAGDDYHWFTTAAAAWNRPRDWADIRLGDDPDDPADLDFDNMADAWEMLQFASATGDGTADTDGDGRADVEEYQAGTDPKAASSRFMVSRYEKAGGLLDIRWPSATGCLYTVETSDDLGTWQPFCDSLPGTGAEMSCLVDPTLPQAGRFFRIRAQRCP